MQRVGIFGSSGMAREAGDVAIDLGFDPLYVARSQSELDSWTFEADIILEKDVIRYKDIPYVIGIGDNIIRKKIADCYGHHITFFNLIHSSATFGYRQRQLIDNNKGVIICAGVRFTNNIQIGDHSIINQNATLAHDVTVGEFTHIASGCSISGNVHIGHNCWIGAGSVINEGTHSKKLSIGNHTIIGSGTVVINSCESNSIYVGVPARKIK